MYCNHCGKELQPNATFCGECGESAGSAPPTLAQDRLTRHLNLLGVLWITLSSMRLLGGGVILLVAGFIPIGGSEASIRNLIYMLVLFLGGAIVALAVAGGLAGWGLMQRITWARSLALTVAFLSLLEVPFGTALSVYTLWVLMPEEAARAYDSAARPA